MGTFAAVSIWHCSDPPMSPLQTFRRGVARGRGCELYDPGSQGAEGVIDQVGLTLPRPRSTANSLTRSLASPYVQWARPRLPFSAPCWVHADAGDLRG